MNLKTVRALIEHLRESDGKLDHVSISVDDVTSACRFLEAVFVNARRLHLSDQWGFYDFGLVKIALVDRNRHPNHLAFQVGRDTLGRICSDVGKDVSDYGDFESLYLEAPGGFNLELVHYKKENLG